MLPEVRDDEEIRFGGKTIQFATEAPPSIEEIEGGGDGTGEEIEGGAQEAGGGGGGGCQFAPHTTSASPLAGIMLSFALILLVGMRRKQRGDVSRF